MRIGVLVLLAGCPHAGLGPAGPDRSDRMASTARIGRKDVPPPPALPTLPTTTHSRWDDALPAPPVSGTAEGLDLTRLRRTVTRYDLELDVTALGRVGLDHQEAVFRALAALPSWRVTEYDQAIVAFRRVREERGWTVPRHGFHFDEAGAWRTVLRFTAWDAGLPWVVSANVARIDAAATRVSLEPFVVRDPRWIGLFATALDVEGDQIALEVYEAGPRDTRDRTAEALTDVPTLVDAMVSRAAVSAAKGWDPLLVPNGEPEGGEAWVALSNVGPGELELTARLAPSEPGWCWLRLMTGEGPWEEESVAVGTREALGWSAAADRLFWMQGRFGVPPGGSFEAEAEVWCLGVGAAEPVRIYTGPVEVPQR